MSQIKDSLAVAPEITHGPDEVDASTDGGVAPRSTGRTCCCCSAPPAFTVIITSKIPARHSVDVLMCGHHYRECAPMLTLLTPLVFDRAGYLVAPSPRSWLP